MRKANPDGDVRRKRILFKHKGNSVKCERCSEKAREDVYIPSRVFAETGRPPLQCASCHRTDWWQVRRKKVDE